MSNSLTLAHSFTVENESYPQNLNDLVESSSKVIAPLGPITTFAARHPWEGMERESFEEVARRLKAVIDVDIFPNESVLWSAQNRGEIHQEFLEMGLQNGWMHNL